MDRRRLTIPLLTLTVAFVPLAETAVAQEKPTRGQCTVWANYKRPDLKISANGHRWNEIAKAKGFPVGRKPRKGDIAVWEANQRGAFSTGHVAYVVRVQSNGKIVVSEFNWGSTRLRYGTRSNLSPAGLKFIHK